jgi:hypothetical protein
MLKETKEESLKDSILDALSIIKATLTTFWFWLPVLFAVLLYVELYLMIINPLLIIIAPALIIVYALRWEEKRARAQYGDIGAKATHNADSKGATLQEGPTQEEVDKLVEEYQKLLSSKDSSKDSEESS